MVKLIHSVKENIKLIFPKFRKLNSIFWLKVVHAKEKSITFLFKHQNKYVVVKNKKYKLIKKFIRQGKNFCCKN